MRVRKCAHQKPNNTRNFQIIYASYISIMQYHLHTSVTQYESKEEAVQIENGFKYFK